MVKRSILIGPLSGPYSAIWTAIRIDHIVTKCLVLSHTNTVRQTLCRNMTFFVFFFFKFAIVPLEEKSNRHTCAEECQRLFNTNAFNRSQNHLSSILHLWLRKSWQVYHCVSGPCITYILTVQIYSQSNESEAI